MITFIKSSQYGSCLRYYMVRSLYAGPSGRAIYGRSPAAIMGSNPTRGVDVCMLCVLCVVR
jgi:hypothetical protein